MTTPTTGGTGLARPARDPIAAQSQRHTAALLNDSGEVLDRAAAWGRQLAVLMPVGHRLLVAGNGGSAAQAQHLSAEFVGRFRAEREPYSAIALHTDTSAFTAIVNDYGAAEAFARGVQAHGRPGDVLLLLSTSGRSSNLLAAAERAQRLGLRIWAMTGAAPNPLAELATECGCVGSTRTSAIQEVHQVALHVLCAAFDDALELEGAR